MKHRSTRDVIAGVVIGPRSRPEAIVVGLPIDGELHIVGQTTPLRPHVARDLATDLRPPAGEHPWPEPVSPGAPATQGARAGGCHQRLLRPARSEHARTHVRDPRVRHHACCRQGDNRCVRAGRRRHPAHPGGTTTLRGPDYLLRIIADDLPAFQELYDERIATLPGVQRLSSTLVMKSVVQNRPLPL